MGHGHTLISNTGHFSLPYNLRFLRRSRGLDEAEVLLALTEVPSPPVPSVAASPEEDDPSTAAAVVDMPERPLHANEGAMGGAACANEGPRVGTAVIPANRMRAGAADLRLWAEALDPALEIVD